MAASAAAAAVAAFVASGAVLLSCCVSTHSRSYVLHLEGNAHTIHNSKVQTQ